MDRTEMMAEVKKNLKLLDGAQDLVISDTILAVCDYCNLSKIPFTFFRISWSR